MKKHFEWTTPKGANVELTVDIEHITKRSTSADGDVVEIDCDEWIRTVETFKLNGIEQPMKKLDSNRNAVIGNQTKRNIIGVLLPDDIIEEIFGEERRARKERLDRELAAAAEREAHAAKVRRMMMTGRA